MKYDLVFEGGGAKGMVFVGALRAFVEAGGEYGRLLGTSAGAITATLLAAGYGVEELQAALVEEKEGQPVFATFLSEPAIPDRAALAASDIRQMLCQINLRLVPDSIESRVDDELVQWLGRQPRMRHVFSFIEHGGWYAADNFLSWLQEKLDRGSFHDQPRRFSGLTLGEFYEQTGVDLTMIASDATAQRMLALNHRTAPQLPLIWAVRMSMSIPLLWQEVTWKEEWGLYRERNVTGHAIVDGGVLSNFPLELFVSGDATVLKVMGPRQGHAVIGLLIDESLPVQGAEPEEKQGLHLDQLAIVRRLSNLVDTMSKAHDKLVIETFEEMVVHLPAQGYATTEFGMSPARRDCLVRAGYETMQSYLEHQAMKSFGAAAWLEKQAQQIADRMALKMLGRL